MSDPERIERLESRVDRIEDHLGNEVEKLSLKIDALGAVINNHLIAAAKAHCPAPGHCLILANDMKAITAAESAKMQRILVLEDRVLCLEKWQWKTAGAFSLLLVVLTLFAPAIRKMLNLE